MLLTAQENAVRQWVVAALADCPPLNPIPLGRVVWSQQDFAELAYPYALLSYTGSVVLSATPGRILKNRFNFIAADRAIVFFIKTIMGKVIAVG